jgi:uncharacterized membrane protein YdbT with pleckstrin-like domain
VASYVDTNLLAQEKVLYRAHTSLWSLAPLILLGILLLVVVVGLFVLIAAWIKYRTTEFAVTDRRVIAKSGLVSRRTVEMFLDKVESLNVEQSVAGRVFDYGTVTIRGTGATSETFANISAPLALRKNFMDAADSFRRKA